MTKSKNIVMPKRKLCATCRWRSSNKYSGRCAYILLTGHMRGCSSLNCKKYEEGALQRVPDEEGAWVFRADAGKLPNSNSQKCVEMTT